MSKTKPRADLNAMLRASLQSLNNGQIGTAETLLRQVRMQAPANADACNMLGILCAQTQRQGEAHQLLLDAVRLAPKNAQCWYNLGNVQIGLGLFREAIETFHKALKLHPRWAEAENNLGNAYCGTHQFEEARDRYIKAISLRKEYGAAQENLGNVLLNLGDIETAIKSLERARTLLPESPKLLNNLANAYAVGKQPDKAAELYDKALEKSRDFETLKNRAILAITMQQYTLATELLNEAIQQRSQDAVAFILLAIAQENRELYEEAIRHYHHAKDLGYSAPAVELCLGQICSTLGDFEQAIRHYETALRLDPDLTEAMGALSSILNLDQPSLLVDKIRNALATLQLPDADRINLCFALGRQYDRMGQFEDAFTYYTQGNQLRFSRDYIDYDIALFRDQVSLLIETFSTQFLSSFSAFGCGSDRPIIIFGMPRSGTTLTEQILASHSQVHAAGELPFFHELDNRLATENCKDDWPRCLSQFDQWQFSGLAQQYLDHLDQINPGSFRVTNKMPHNFLSVGLIYLLFPKAQFIHCTRNPLDNCLSLYFQNFSGNHPYAYDLSVLGQYYVEYQRLVDHWKTVLPAPIMEMEYESTVANAESIARKLIGFCQLPWEDACLEFYKTKRAVKTASVWQARQKIYSSSVGRWENYESHLSSLIEALGPLADQKVLLSRP